MQRCVLLLMVRLRMGCVVEGQVDSAVRAWGGSAEGFPEEVMFCLRSER